MPADILLIAGVLWATMDREDFKPEQLRAIDAALAVLRNDGPILTPEQCATIRALANETIETGWDAVGEAEDQYRQWRP